MVAYCNTQCQKSDYVSHKKQCEALACHQELSNCEKIIRRNVETFRDTTVPLCAAENNNVEILEFLQIRGTLRNVIHEQDDLGRTLVMIAVQNGHVGVVQYLVSQGADYTLATHDGLTPLGAAIELCYDDVAEYLCQLS